MSTVMRAKMRVNEINVEYHPQNEIHYEMWKFNAVGRTATYPEDGSDENNTFAKWSPSGNLTLTCTNPALFDTFKVGDELYLDFSFVSRAQDKNTADVQTDKGKDEDERQ